MLGLTASFFPTIGQSSCKCLYLTSSSPVEEKRPEPEETPMDIRYGLISADSHVVTGKDAFVSRMSKSKWGDRIPQVIEVESKGRRVHRWAVNGKSLGGRGVCNCPAVKESRAIREDFLPPVSLCVRLAARDQEPGGASRKTAGHQSIRLFLGCDHPHAGQVLESGSGKRMCGFCRSQARHGCRRSSAAKSTAHSSAPTTFRRFWNQDVAEVEDHLGQRCDGHILRIDEIDKSGYIGK